MVSVYYLLIDFKSQDYSESSKLMIWFCFAINQIVLMIPVEHNLNDWNKSVRILILIISLKKVRTLEK
jgi:hypothetical protein